MSSRWIPHLPEMKATSASWVDVEAVVFKPSSKHVCKGEERASKASRPREESLFLLSCFVCLSVVYCVVCVYAVCLLLLFLLRNGEERCVSCPGSSLRLPPARRRLLRATHRCHPRLEEVSGPQLGEDGIHRDFQVPPR